MSSSIKPPGSPEIPSTGLVEREDASSIGEVDAREADDPSVLAAELRAGRISVDAAVDRLVSEAIAAIDPAVLDSTRRIEIEQRVRETLAADPNLADLIADLKNSIV